MANSIEEILGKKINSVKELKNEIKSLQDSLIGLDTESAEYKGTVEKLTAAQGELNKVTKASSQDNKAAEDSVVGLEKQYRELYNTYKLLSEEQRNSAPGKEMAKNLNNLSNQINEAKKNVGNFKDNIGRYADSTIEAFSKMGISVKNLQGPLNLAKNGMSGLNAVMKANPVGMVVTALMSLIAILGKAKDAISSNEELQMRWNQAMAAFQPIIDAAKNGIDAFAQKVVAAVEFISNMYNKIRELGAAITDFLGITEGAKDQVKEQQALYAKIAKSQNDLTKAKREYQKLNAADQEQVETLREQASETQDVEEKTKLLNQAKEAQAQIDQRNLEIAQQELEILKEKAELTANSAADNEALAAAEAKVSQAAATAASNQRRFNKEIKAAGSSAKSSAGSIKNLAAEEKKLAQELHKNLIEENKSDLQKLEEKYKKEKDLLVKYNLDTTLLDKKYAKERVEVEKQMTIQIQTERQKRIKEEREPLQNEQNKLDASIKNATTEEGKLEAIYKQRVANFKDVSEQMDKFETSLNKYVAKTQEDAVNFIEPILRISEQSEEAVQKRNNSTLISVKNYYSEIVEKNNAAIEEIEAKENEFIKGLKENGFAAELANEFEDTVERLNQYLGTNFKLDFSQLFNIESRKDLFAASGPIQELASQLRAAVVKAEQEVDKSLGEITLNAEREFEEDFMKRYGNYVEGVYMYVQNAHKGLNETAEMGRTIVEDSVKKMRTLLLGISDLTEEEMKDILPDNFFGEPVKNFQDANLQIIKIEELTTRKLIEYYEKELEDFKGTQEQKEEIFAKLREYRKKQVEAQIELEVLAAERTVQVWQDAYAAFDDISSSVDSIASAIENLKKAELDEGNLSKKEYERKKKQIETLQKVQLAAQIMSIAGSTAQGMIGIWDAYAKEKVVNAETAAAAGPAAAGVLAGLNAKSLASAILQTAGLAATAAAQIAAARGGYISSARALNSSSNDNSSASSSVATIPSMVDTNPYSYYRELQTDQEKDNMNQPIWVSVVDVENALGHQAQVRDEVSF